MTVTTRLEAEEVVSALRRFISRGEYGLREVPQLIKEVLEHRLWQAGQRTFEAFPEFVEAAPPPGLGTTISDVRQLIAHDKDALELFDREMTRAPWRPRKSVNNVNTSTVVWKRPTGNDRQQALRRLRKDRPDLHKRVLAGELSPHGAMVEAGFRPHAYRLPLTVDGLVATIRRHFNPEQITEVVRRLGGDEP